MFATIVGALPDPPGAEVLGAERALRAQLAGQVERGIELLSFGEPVAGTPEEIVRGWERAAALAADLGQASVKATIVGPFTAGRGRRPGRAVIQHIREAVVALVSAGCPLVEVHEPSAVDIGADESARARFRDTHLALTDGIDGHLCLAITGGNADAAGAATIFSAPYLSYLFDLIRGPDNWRLVVAAPPTVGIVAGAIDHRPNVREVPETGVWAAHYAASTGGRGIERVALSSSGSLTGLEWAAALDRLVVVGEAARIAALPPGEELGRAIDPRAVDIRSAALGRYAPFRPPQRRRSRG